MWSIFLIQEKQTRNKKVITNNKKTNYQEDNPSEIELQIKETNLMPGKCFDRVIFPEFTNIYHLVCGACGKREIIAPININNGSCTKDILI